MKIIGGATFDAGRLCCRKSSRCFAGDDFPGIRAALMAAGVMSDGDWEDFRRGGAPSRLAMVLAAAAAFDAGTEWQPETAAIIGWGGAGIAPELSAYWRDYVANGRELGRGALFVGTLESTAICEAAILLGAHGPGGSWFSGEGTPQLFAGLTRLFSRRGVGSALVLELAPTRGAAAVITPESGNEYPGADELYTLLDTEVL